MPLKHTLHNGKYPWVAIASIARKYYTLSRLYQCRRGTITLKLISKDIIEQMSVSHPLNISVVHANPIKVEMTQYDAGSVAYFQPSAQ